MKKCIDSLYIVTLDTNNDIKSITYQVIYDEMYTLIDI